jgi:hypothetical protein
VDDSVKNGNILYNANLTGNIPHTISTVVNNETVPQSTKLLTTLYVANQSYIWSTKHGWKQDGNIAAYSQVLWYSVINWDASLLFFYGNDKYQISVVDSNYDDPSFKNLYIFGSGVYGGNWQTW